MIGDVLTSTIVCEALKQQYNSAQLHYLIAPNTLAVVQGNPYIDKAIILDDREVYKTSSNYINFVLALRKEKYDIVIDIYAKLSTSIITYLTESKDTRSIYKWYSKLLIKQTFKPTTEKQKQAKAIINRLRLVYPTCEVHQIPEYRPKIYLAEDEIQQAQKSIDSHRISPQQKVVMIGILGSSTSKSYPDQYMAEVLDFLVEKSPNVLYLLNYIPSQKPQVDRILQYCKKETQHNINIDLYGKSLREFIGVLSCCDALIGNEGGAVNMAKALEVPTFTIFSPWIKKESWNLFDDGIKHCSVHLKDYHSESFKKFRNQKEIRKKGTTLYQDFKPALFLEDLQTFMDRNLK